MWSLCLSLQLSVLRTLAKMVTHQFLPWRAQRSAGLAHDLMKALLSSWGGNRRGRGGSNGKSTSGTPPDPAGAVSQAAHHQQAEPSGAWEGVCSQEFGNVPCAPGSEAGSGAARMSHESGSTRGRQSVDIRSLSDSVDTIKLSGVPKASSELSHPQSSGGSVRSPAWA